jgi:hypothetical protein
MAGDDATPTVPLCGLVAGWWNKTDTLVPFKFRLVRASRRPLHNAVRAKHNQALRTLRFCYRDAVTVIEAGACGTCGRLLRDTLSVIEFVSLGAFWLRVGMFLTPFVDRSTAVGAFAFNWLGIAHVPIPSHAKWAATDSAMSLVDRRSCTRLAGELAEVHTLLVMQLCSRGALELLGNGARLDLGVENRTVTTGRLGSGDAQPILEDSVLWALRLGHRNTAKGCGIERGALRTDWRLDVNAHTAVKFTSVLTFGAFDGGAAGTSEMLAVGTHRWLQRHANIPLQLISRATECLSFNHTVVASENCITGAGRGLDSDAKAILELVFSLTGWLCLEDTCLTIPGTVARTDRSTENTGLSIELCSLRATFDVARSWVGSRDDVVKGVLSIGGLAWGILGCGKGHRE